MVVPVMIYTHKAIATELHQVYQRIYVPPWEHFLPSMTLVAQCPDDKDVSYCLVPNENTNAHEGSGKGLVWQSSTKVKET